MHVFFINDDRNSQDRSDINVCQKRINYNTQN
jgi:hypothetical protein